MNIRIENADIVAILALALVIALLLALRFRPQSWRAVVLEALLANAAAFGAVIAVEALLASGRLDEAEERRTSPQQHIPASAPPMIVAVGGGELPEFLRQWCTDRWPSCC